MDIFSKRPYNEKTITLVLHANGHKAYLVGGAVRDILMGKEPSDFDIATDATPDRIQELFAWHTKTNFVGKSFGVSLINGTEVATFRQDTHNGGGHKDTDVNFVGSIEEDLDRRDFTINAMAINLVTGELVDPHGGLNDLMNKMVRFVGVPAARIAEDNNRIFRAFRFAATLGFELDWDSNRAISQWSGSYRVAGERIRMELLKTMERTQKASVFFELLHTTGILKTLIPELENCWAHPHGQYHGESVWEHNMLVGDAISCKFPLVKLAGYLHDVGKPETYSDDGQTFHDHESSGAHSTHNRLGGLLFSTDECLVVSRLVKHHMRPLRELSPKARRRLLVLVVTNDMNWRDLVRLRIADCKGNTLKTPKSISTIKEYVKTFIGIEEATVVPTQLAISGGEIMAVLGVEPGPAIGHMQKMLLAYVINNGEEFNTHEHLLSVIKELRED